MLRKTVLALAALGVVLAASACNTVKGVGRDIESVGQAGDRAMRYFRLTPERHRPLAPARPGHPREG